MFVECGEEFAFGGVDEAPALSLGALSLWSEAEQAEPILRHRPHPAGRRRGGGPQQHRIKGAGLPGLAQDD